MCLCQGSWVTFLARLDSLASGNASIRGLVTEPHLTLLPGVVNPKGMTTVMVLVKTVERPVVNTHKKWVGRGCRWLCWGPVKSKEQKRHWVQETSRM